MMRTFAADDKDTGIAMSSETEWPFRMLRDKIYFSLKVNAAACNKCST